MTKISKYDVLVLFEFLKEANAPILNKHYINFIIRNRELLKIEDEIIRKTLSSFAPTDAETKFSEDEYKILLEYAATKDNSKELVKPLQIAPGNESTLKAKLEELQAKDGNAEIIKSIQTKNEEITKIYAEEVELELLSIDFDNLPETINTNIYELLLENKLIN